MFVLMNAIFHASDRPASRESFIVLECEGTMLLDNADDSISLDLFVIYLYVSGYTFIYLYIYTHAYICNTNTDIGMHTVRCGLGSGAGSRGSRDPVNGAIVNSPEGGDGGGIDPGLVITEPHPLADNPASSLPSILPTSSMDMSLV